MTNKELVNRFIDFETNNKLFSLTFKDVRYWHLIRFSIFRIIQNDLFKYGKDHCGNTNKLNAIFNITKNLLKFKSLRILLPKTLKENKAIFMSHSRKIKYEGRYIDPISSLLLEDLKIKSLSFDSWHQYKHFDPNYNKNVIYTDLMDIVVWLKTRFKITNVNQIKEDCYWLSSKLSNEFGIILEGEVVFNIIKKSFLNFTLFTKNYKKFLAKVNPSIVFLVTGYDIKSMAFIKASRSLKIPSVELQHGTMGKYHIGYNYSLKNKQLEYLPDYYFTFGDYWKKTSMIPIEAERIISIGNPYIYKRVKIETSINPEKTIDLLIISQGIFGHKLSELAIETTHKLGEKFNIVFKLHPGEFHNWKREYPKLLESNLQVIDNNINDIHYYLSRTKTVLGVASTALFESLNYEVKLLIYNLPGHEYMEDIIVNDNASIVSDVEEIFRYVKKNSIDLQKNREHYWRNYDAEHLNIQVNKIIGD